MSFCKIEKGELIDRSGFFILALTIVFGALPILAAGTQADILETFTLPISSRLRQASLPKKGHTKQVRDYGKRLIKDHTKLDKEVEKTAKREGIDVNVPIAEVDEKMNTKETDLMNKLRSVNGVEFDQTFAKEMDVAHQEAITSLKAAEAQYKGTDTARLIGKILPTLAKHERIAEKIERRLAECRKRHKK